jgi:DNA (cytosine-5)-methyltransferase 1
MAALYNEFDPKAAAWLRELIKRGLIADGEVDERSILDLCADDLRGFTQVHFFAGIGGWSYALRLAGWPDDKPVWTGSPPCQPFSAAGQQKGKDDERHLAPHFATLVAAGRPPILFGEQVASSAVFGKAAKRAGGAADGAAEWAWLDDLCGRLEAAHYAVGASDIPAAGVGAPHIRQRTFFGAVRLADADHTERGADAAGGNNGNGPDAGWQEGAGHPEGCGGDVWPSPTDSFWSDADWLFCRDGKWRPVVASYVALAHGISDRMVLCCDGRKPAEKAQIDGTKSKADADAGVPELRGSTEPPQVWGEAGGFVSIQPPSVLRPGLHGDWDAEGGLPECQSQQAEGGSDGWQNVYSLREGGAVASPSSGREPFQQQPIELADIVRQLPSQVALAKLHGRDADASALQALQHAVCQEGALCYTPEQAQAAWSSIGEEAQGRLNLGFGGAFARVTFSPLSKGEAARVVRLRGYGNAIVPQAAATFIGCFTDSLSGIFDA